MLISIHPDNPNIREIGKLVQILKSGGLVIFPTDTIYGMGCDITNSKAVEKIARIKGIDLAKSNFSFICSDLSHLSEFTKQVNNNVYKIMKRNLPGPFTFILQANSNVPKLFKSRKKTVGIRIPDNKICLEIVRELGNPIMTTSIPADASDIEFNTDPELIHEKYEKLVDCVIDGGHGGIVPSTVVDCTGDEIFLIREGKGDLV